MIKTFPDPNKGIFTQVNRGNVAGAIWSSMGLDLQSNLGVVRVAQRLRIGADTTDDSDLGLPVAFKAWDTVLMSVCGAKVFRNNTTPNGTWTEDASTNAPSTCNSGSDLAVFDSRLWVTAAGALLSKVSNGSGTGAYTSRDTYASPGPHPMTTFVKFPRLYYVCELGEIASIDAGNTVNKPSSGDDYSVAIAPGSITCLASNSTYIWGGISANASNGDLQGRVIQWDGISQQITNSFPIKGAQSIIGIVIKNDIPYCLDNLGILSAYTGTAFEEVGRLPFGPFPTGTSASSSKNGMIVTENNTILVNTNNLNRGSTASYNENNASGVFEWSEQYGFVHKFSFTYNKQGSSTITDFGQNQISAIGAIYDTTNFGAGTSGYSGQYIAGATIFTDASNTLSAIFFDDSTQSLRKKGYFVTTWMGSDQIADKWTRLWETHRRLLDSSDSIVFKYRTTEESPVTASITWVNTTSFTTTTDITAYGPTAFGFNGTTGGEVEIVRGTGGASCAHVTNIVNNAGTYTVTLDTAITGVTTGTAVARFQKWIKIFPETTGQVLQFSEKNIGKQDTRIQVKACMTFLGDDEFHKFAIWSNSDINIDA